MSLDTLKEAILSEAQTKARQISDDLAGQLAADESRIMSRARKLEEEIIREADKEADRKAKLVRQEAELSGRAAVLAAKEEELEKAKRAFLKDLLGQDEAQIKPLISALIDTVADMEGVIVPGEQHSALVGSLIKKNHTAGKDTIAEEGGFVFRGESIEVNLTFSYLVEQLFKRHRAELAKILFS